MIPAGDLPAVPTRAGSPFATSTTLVSQRANEFWKIYGVGDAPADFDPKVYGLNPAWNDWDARKFAWTPRKGLRDAVAGALTSQKINGLDGTTGALAKGFLWSWGDREAWPDDNSFHGGVGSYHFDQLPRYLSAVSRMALWSGDPAFVTKVLTRAEYVMDNFIVPQMKGDTQVLTIQLAQNNGAGTRPSNYLDQVKFGYQDAWANAYYQSALEGMAELEDLANRPTQRDVYRHLAQAFPDRYDAAFWNAGTNRYAAWRDKNGSLHDPGHVLVNMDALSRGLGDIDKAQHVFDWLDHPAAASQGGVHQGSTSVYPHVAAPRTNTADVPLSDWDGWSDPVPGPRKPYGTNVSNGGTLLMTTYFEAEARLRYDSANAAFGVIDRMLSRMSSDSHRLTFSSSRAHNDFGEDIVELGTNEPFPESGQSILTLLDGFVGAQALAAGLSITPNLPTDLLDLTIHELEFNRQPLTLTVSRGTVVVSEEGANAVSDVPGGGALSQTFTSPGTFDEIGVLVGTYTRSNVALTVRLEVQGAHGFVPVASGRFAAVRDNQWVHLALPPSPAGMYRVSIAAPSSQLAWYHNASSGAFAYRAISTVRETTAAQGDGSTVDPFTSTIGETFITASPFDGLTLQVHASAGAGVIATVSRDVGGRWAERARFEIRELAAGDDTIALHVPTLPPGKYWIQLFNPTGTVDWARTETDSLADSAATVGGTTIDGDRRFTVTRQRFRVTVPERTVDVLVRSGAHVIVPR